MPTPRLMIILAMSGCGDSSPPQGRSTSPVPAVTTPVRTTPAGTTTTRSDDGKCTPLPIAGTPCGVKDSWCVVSWGKPGGASTALWCRDAHWQLEQETNLPADDEAAD
ncbi:MAG: hypothetical protein IPQ07_22140 [Myxococcales bacterium]|nr:hypothetical protein [Myxococcales bacterium]